MDLEFNDDQRAVHDAILGIMEGHQEVPRTGATVEAAPWIYGEALERELSDGGYFSLGLTEGFGALESALLVYEVSRSPLVVETAGSALIGAQLTGTALPRPVAVARQEDLARGVRFLDRARTLIVDAGDDVLVLPTEGLVVLPVDAMYAYPMSRLTTLPRPGSGQCLGASKVATLRRLWRTGIALEAAAAMQAAIDFTVEYIKQRRVFGRSVGTFQAVQHRIAIDAQKARGAYWLAIKAAWSGAETDAAIAALYAQQAITSVNYNTHQFNGALGMTLEHSLHLWTFRLRLLQAELGGARVQSAAVADLAWPAATDRPNEAKQAR